MGKKTPSKPPNLRDPELLALIVVSLAAATVLACSLLRDVQRFSSRPPALARKAPLPARAPAIRKAPSVPQLLQRFSADRAMVHVRVLADDIGRRHGGTAQERHAAQYIAAVFKQYGYRVRWQISIPIPESGRRTQNVCAIKPSSGAGDDGLMLVVGAHYDSIDATHRSPGANDNASGVAVMLEASRALRDVPLPYRVEFVAFGAEERQGTRFEHHHYGSRHYVRQYRAGAAEAQIAGMLSVDMIGVGETLYVRSMNRPDRHLVEKAQQSARRLGIALPLKPDAHGCSDHEPFEELGIPVAWLERLPDPDNHTARDRCENLSRTHLQTTGRLLLHLLASLDHSDLQHLAAASPRFHDRPD